MTSPKRIKAFLGESLRSVPVDTLRKSKAMSKDKPKRTYSDDVFYRVWRSGGSVDRVNSDRVEDCYYQGMESQRAARIETEAQRKNIECADCETTEGQ